MRIARTSKRRGGTALLPKAMARRLHRLGVNPLRYLTVAPVSLDDYRDLERRLEAKTARVGWQSSHILSLRAEVAALRTVLATLPAMQDTEAKQRLIQLETQQALHDAIHRLTEREHRLDGEM